MRQAFDTELDRVRDYHVSWRLQRELHVFLQTMGRTSGSHTMKSRTKVAGPSVVSSRKGYGQYRPQHFAARPGEVVEVL